MWRHSNEDSDDSVLKPLFHLFIATYRSVPQGENKHHEDNGHDPNLNNLVKKCDVYNNTEKM